MVESRWPESGTSEHSWSCKKERDDIKPSNEDNCFLSSIGIPWWPANFSIHASRDWGTFRRSSKQPHKQVVKLTWRSCKEGKDLCCWPFKEKILDSQMMVSRVCPLESPQFQVYTHPWEPNKKEGLTWVRFHLSDPKGILEWVHMGAYFIDDWKETWKELFKFIWRAGNKAQLRPSSQTVGDFCPVPHRCVAEIKEEHGAHSQARKRIWIGPGSLGELQSPIWRVKWGMA